MVKNVTDTRNNNRHFPHSTLVRLKNSTRARLGWTFAVFLSTLTSTRCYCLLECRKGLLTRLANVHFFHPAVINYHDIHTEQELFHT